MDKKSKLLQLFFGIYTASIIIQNVLATKQIDVFMFTVTTGILISPIVFIIQDIIAEMYGYLVAKKMVLLGFLMNFIAVGFFMLAIKLPSSPLYTGQGAFESVLGTTFRISIASFTAYLVGSLTNSKVMVTLKGKNEKGLFFRAIASTVIGQFLDNAIFAFIAFYGVLPIQAIASMVLGGTLFEVAYEILFYPITKTALMKCKQIVGD